VLPAHGVRDRVEQRHAVRLAVREKADRRAREMVRTRRRRCGGRARGAQGGVEDARHDGTSLLTKGTERPRLHEGKKAEWPPASPPPTHSRMSSGPSPRCTRTASSSSTTRSASSGPSGPRDSGAGAPRRDAARGIAEDPLDDAGIAVERLLHLAGALQISERTPGPLVEPLLHALAVPAAAAQMLRVLRRHHDDGAAGAQA